MKKTNTTQSFSQVVNKYTKLDPTLPRIKTIRCPNDDCISNKKRSGSSQASSSADDGSSSSKNQENEVIYVRYDDTNLKYIYLCTKCDKVWNTEQH
jgi:hypothetical protein